MNESRSLKQQQTTKFLLDPFWNFLQSAQYDWFSAV